MRRIVWLWVGILACGGKGGSEDTSASGPSGESGLYDSGTSMTSTLTTSSTTSTSTSTTATMPTGDVVDCEASWAEVKGVECGVESGSGDALLIRADLLGPGVSYRGGELLVDGEGQIVCVGCDCSAEEAAKSATIYTCPDVVVSPGLINPHDHISYTEGAPIDHGATRYDHRHDWRGTLSTPSNPHGGNSSTGSGNRWGEIRMVMSGVTSMVGSGYAAGMVRNLEYSDGLEGLSIAPVENETFPLGDANESFRDNCTWSYALNEWEASQESAFLPHTAEGIDDYAYEEFYCSSRSTDGGEDFVESNVAHIHAIGLGAVDYYNMARDQSGLIWSPRSNISLYGMTADVVTFHRLGGVIALGTDWTYSGSMNQLRELTCADEFNRVHLNGYFSDYELWRMATTNGASVMGMSDQIGTLEVGRLADLALYRSPEHRLHRDVIEAGVQDTVLVLRAGVPLFGASNLIGATCEELDVCGSSRRLCAEQEFGETYTDLRLDVLTAYPAFFCEEPDDEPTCEPSRLGEYAGVTKDDSDGDGLADVVDNCPLHFNPRRPMDGTTQADADADGTGDPCDEVLLPADIDGDGELNGDDNCPFHSNASQDDRDEDGKGAECDVCEEEPNPESVCSPEAAEIATIVDIQQRTEFYLGRRVELSAVVVTGVGSAGYTLQDRTVADRMWSGVYVYTGTTPTVSRNDTLTVEGEVSDYYGETQLVNSVVTVDVGATTPIDPIELTTEEAADMAYEGVLVTVTTGPLTDSDFDCGCSDEGLWELAGEDGVVVFDRLYEDDDWADHVGDFPATGVMGYRYDRRRLMPRTATDFE